VTEAEDPKQTDGTPVGRRTVLGLVALGAVGVVTGHWVQEGLSRVLAPIELRDPTGLTALIPLGDTFRFYSVTGSVSVRTAATYSLDVSGLVTHARSYSLPELQALPQTSFVQDFQCVTGWRVPQVHWSGVRLADLLDLAQPTPQATARRGDVIVALRMLGRPVSHDHGGPVRIYAGGMYGYKSTKWLSGIELTQSEIPGYWEHRGYDVDGFIKR
jgi:DMSO/TMAO reductase YedYZ molybdopterin-dependent catalytic subunit